MRKSCTVGALAPILTLTLLPAATASFAQAPPSGPVDTARLLRNVEAAQGKITSLQSTVEENAQNFVTTWKGANGQDYAPPPAHEVYTAAFKGDKRYSETLPSDSDPAGLAKEPLYQVTLRNVFDGKQAYFCENPKPGTESLRPALWVPMPGHGAAPGAIEWMYTVGSKNVADVIRDKVYLSISSVPSAEFGTVVRIDLDPRQEFGPDSDGTAHIDLAPSLGYMVVDQRVDSKNGYGEKKLTKFRKIGGVFLPVEVENKQYTSSDGVMKPFRFENWHFSHTNLNHVPASLFVVKIKPGDIVQEDSSRYRIGANGGHIVEWSDNSTRSRKMLFGWLFMASLATLLLLGIGFLVRYQGRRDAG